MVLKNQSAQAIQITANRALSFVLQPGENKTVSYAGGPLTLQLAHAYGSCVGDCFGFADVCQIVIDTVFTFSHTTADSVIQISREKELFEFGYTYDRFFCCCDGYAPADEAHTVADREALETKVMPRAQKDERFDRALNFAFLGPLGGSTALFLIVKLICWANDRSFSWLWILLFWAGGYALSVLIDKLLAPVFRDSPTKNFLAYTSPEHIQTYYSDPHRKPIERETEG